MYGYLFIFFVIYKTIRGGFVELCFFVIFFPKYASYFVLRKNTCIIHRIFLLFFSFFVPILNDQKQQLKDRFFQGIR